MKQQMGELEADHKAAIAAHSVLEEHLDSQAAAEKELAALRCAHAQLEANHAQATAAHAALEERLLPMEDLQRRHASLEVRWRPMSFPFHICAAMTPTQPWQIKGASTNWGDGDTPVAYTTYDVCTDGVRANLDCNLQMCLRRPVALT